MKTTMLFKDEIASRLDIASKITVMLYLQYISLAALEDVKYIPLLITMPILLFMASTLGDSAEIATGLMINIKALLPHVCALLDMTCPHNAVFWFHYQTFSGLINFIIIFIAIYLYCLVIVLKFENRSEEITAL